MQTADRSRFDELVDQLCAGLNVPATKHRRDALWTGLRKMTIAQFERVADLGLTENGLDEISTKAIWKLHRQGRGAVAGVQTSARVMSDPDHLEYFANRLLFQHLTHRGGLKSSATFVPGTPGTSGMTDAKASPELGDCLEFKRELVREWLPYIRERDADATPAEFLRRWILGLRRVSRVDSSELTLLQAFADDPRSLVPFPAHFAESTPVSTP